MLNKDSTVFVVQDPDGKEITDAKSFGTIKVILTGRESTSQAIALLKDALKDFKPWDYLLLVGRSINMGIAVHLASVQTGGLLNILVWHREHWAYTKETIDIYDNNQSTNSATFDRKRYSKGCETR